MADYSKYKYYKGEKEIPTYGIPAHPDYEE
jgi:hypothetical protein